MEYKCYVTILLEVRKQQLQNFILTTSYELSSPFKFNNCPKRCDCIQFIIFL